MGLPVDERRIDEADQALGRSLPRELRERLMRDNGADVTVSGYPGDDPVWQLHPIWDPSDRRSGSRSTNHVVRETEEARSAGDLADGVVVIGANGTGDRLILPAGDDRPHTWDHETGETNPVDVDWGA